MDLLLEEVKNEKCCKPKVNMLMSSGALCTAAYHDVVLFRSPYSTSPTL